MTFVPNDRLNAIFSAVVLATEEAIVNALVAGGDDDGHGGPPHRGDPPRQAEDGAKAVWKAKSVSYLGCEKQNGP